MPQIIKRDVPPPFTLIRDWSGGAEQHQSLDGLALRIQAIRAKRGLTITPCIAAYDGGDEFEGFNVSVTPRGGSPEWAATIVVPHGQLDALKAAIQRAAKPLQRAA
ncbi:hypothetical protein [Caulobacter endophyticus]|uniref:Uncharacterized protein n=1 Tax=Caulobacter endophyticus TaxID=2172652 RepID=A0A2T9K3X2_9CAUL|nr:hypothetical protein [Caulobacter endophyticus]PVM90682.1 hypothetical protein DDF67_09640 [Caulobacter endophyticus]